MRFSHGRDCGTGEYHTLSRLSQLILVQTKNKNINKGSNALWIVVENLLRQCIKSMWTLGCKVQRYHGGNKVG